MLVIRLFRVGKKNQPSFKIVVTDKRRSTRAGRFVEEVGFYNPLTKEKVLKSERLKYWLSVGAKPSDTVYNLLISEKITEGKKIPVHKKAKKEPSVAKAMEGEGKKEDVSSEAVVKEEKPAEEKPAKEKIKKEKPVAETPKEKKVEETKEEKPVEEKPAEQEQSEETSKKEAAE